MFDVRNCFMRSDLVSNVYSSVSIFLELRVNCHSGVILGWGLAFPFRRKHKLEWFELH